MSVHSAIRRHFDSISTRGGIILGEFGEPTVEEQEECHALILLGRVFQLLEARKKYLKTLQKMERRGAASEEITRLRIVFPNARDEVSLKETIDYIIAGGFSDLSPEYRPR